jgi:hypothetical protein
MWVPWRRIKMKTSRVWAATGLLLMTLASGTLHAQSATFTLVNDTAFTIYSVYYWPSEWTYEGPDRLGDKTLASGESYEFSPNHGKCRYNIRVTLETGDYEKQWNNINLCTLNTLTLSYSHVTQVLSLNR